MSVTSQDQLIWQIVSHSVRSSALWRGLTRPEGCIRFLKAFYGWGVFVFSRARFFVSRRKVASGIYNVGRTHTIVRLQTRIRRKDGMENCGGFVYVLDGFPQRDFVLWVFMCPINISLFCVSFVSSLSFPATTPRSTTPHLYRTGYHAFTTTAQLPRLSLSRLPRHSSLFYSWVITPELSRSTTHVHGVITPAIVSS